MDPRAAHSLAVDLMRQHGLIALGWQFRWDRATRRFGLCSYRRRVISMSLPLTRLNDEAEVRDTILHEVAHALTPGEDHGYEWKIVARRIGARPERCHPIAGLNQVPADWTGTCADCDIVINRSRRPKDSTLRLARHTRCRWRKHNGVILWRHKGQLLTVDAAHYAQVSRIILEKHPVDISKTPQQPPKPDFTSDELVALMERLDRVAAKL